AILEDHLGNIWIATGAGGGSLGSFSRFDGARWVTYGAAGYAYSIIEDLSGNIWVGTLGDGVGRFDGTGIQTYRTADGLADNWVTSALADRSGNGRPLASGVYFYHIETAEKSMTGRIAIVK